MDKANEIERLKPLADAGDITAQYDLADLYWKNGNKVEAVKWLRKVAEQKQIADERVAKAQYSLGICYLYGDDGVSKDEITAREWLYKSAEQGFALAQLTLGRCYFYGLGGSKDYAKAFECFRNAAEQRQALAWYLLGICHLNGKGVPEDVAQAKECFQKAEDQGLLEAKQQLQAFPN